MRYRLRTLMIVLAIGPPVLALMWFTFDRFTVFLLTLLLLAISVPILGCFVTWWMLRAWVTLPLDFLPPTSTDNAPATKIEN